MPDIEFALKDKVSDYLDQFILFPLSIKKILQIWYLANKKKTNTLSKTKGNHSILILHKNGTTSNIYAHVLEGKNKEKRMQPNQQVFFTLHCLDEGNCFLFKDDLAASCWMKRSMLFFSIFPPIKK